MMIKFINAHDAHRGNTIFINSNQIAAVYEEAGVIGGSLSTKIYGVSGIVWTVEESLKEVIKKIEFTIN